MIEKQPVRIVTARDDPQSWSIELPLALTVHELAALMGGIGVRTVAFPISSGNFMLVPVDAGAPCPTPEQLRDILEHGIPRLPALVARPDLR